jgi:hypothetical protein
MSIIVRLVGNFINEKNESFMYELRINNIKLINYDSIKCHLISLGDLDEEKFEFINMTCDGKNLKLISIENIFEEEKRVWLFCAKKEIRQEIIDIFESNGYKFIINTNTNLCENNNNTNTNLCENNNTSNNSNEEKEQEPDVNDSDSDSEINDNIDFIDIEQKTLPDSVNIDEVNQKTIKLFEEPDFVKLFQIYLHKPVLFKQFYMYISNGNIPQNIETMNNNSDSQIGKSLGKCFHPETKIRLKNGSIKYIKDIDLGDILENGSIVEAVMKIDNKKEETPFYKIKNAGVNKEDIYVTGSHLVYDSNIDLFILVKNYNKSEISKEIHSDWFSCLITNTHNIKIGSELFWDWEDHGIKLTLY